MFSPVFLNQCAKNMQEHTRHFVCSFHNNRAGVALKVLVYVLYFQVHCFTCHEQWLTHTGLWSHQVLCIWLKGNTCSDITHWGAWPQRGPLHRWQQHLVSQCWIKVVKCDVDTLFTVTVLVAWQWSGSPTHECITVKAIKLMWWILTTALLIAEATLWPVQALAFGLQLDSRLLLMEAEIFGNEKCIYSSPYEATFLTNPEDSCVARLLWAHRHSRKQREGAPCHWAWTWESFLSLVFIQIHVAGVR